MSCNYFCCLLFWKAIIGRQQLLQGIISISDYFRINIVFSRNLSDNHNLEKLPDEVFQGAIGPVVL